MDKEVRFLRLMFCCIVDWCVRHDRFREFAAIFVLAYSFQLRAPSELLGVTAGKGSGPAAIYSEGSRIYLQLRRRKNKIWGSRLWRECSCRASRTTCRRHLGHLLKGTVTGAPLFEGITPARTLDVLREILKRLDVPNAELYRTRDLRRGHTLDLQAAKASLQDMRQDGEWRSSAIASYLDLARVAADTVAEAADAGAR